MALAWIDEMGLHLPDYPTVLAHLQEQMRAIFGTDIYLEPDSQEGQMLAIFALALHESYSLAGSVYNAYSPQTAQGTGLSRMVVINGIRRQASGHSQVDLTLIGEAGTLIRNGVVRDGGGNRWLLPEVAIGLSGEVTVTATAEQPGALRAASGEIINIATPCRGWQRVTNRAAAVVGAPVESDAELRGRQYYSTALPSRTVFEGTLGAVAAVAGVARWRGYENDSDQPDANGIPPHHICVVVEGGASQAIADVIAVKKTPGTGTYGDLILDTRDTRGVPSKTRFFRPTNRAVRVSIRLAPHRGFVSTTVRAMREAVSKHINNLPIGDDVLHSRIYCPINDTDMSGQRSFDVLEVLLGFAGGGMAPANLPIAFTEAAICYVDDVEVTLG